MARLGKIRPGPVAIAVTLYDLWRHLPPQQRRQALAIARKHGPRVATKLYDLKRTPRK